MDIDALFSGPIGPLLIFALRIVDVSFSTVRILLSVRDPERQAALFRRMFGTSACGNARSAGWETIP